MPGTGCFLFFFLLLLFPVLFSWIIILSKSMGIRVKVYDNMSNLQSAEHRQGCQSTAHTPEKERLRRREGIRMQENTCEE